MSGGPRTRYTLCFVKDGKIFFIPFYNTTNGFLSKINDGFNDHQVHWFISYVDGRKLYIPLTYPTLYNALSTFIDSKNYSFVRYWDYADHFYPRMLIRPQRSYQYDDRSGKWVYLYYLSCIFDDPSRCYDWSVTITVRGRGMPIVSRTFNRNTQNTLYYYSYEAPLPDDTRPTILMEDNYPNDPPRTFSFDPHHPGEYEARIYDLEN